MQSAAKPPIAVSIVIVFNEMFVQTFRPVGQGPRRVCREFMRTLTTIKEARHQKASCLLPIVGGVPLRN